jgi:hypothetical protein
MAKYREVGNDHNGDELADGVSGMVRSDNGMYTGYRVRWREEDDDGVERQPSKSFSGKKHGSLDQALKAATAFLAGAQDAVKVDGSVTRPDPAANKTLEALLQQEWIKIRGKEVGAGYAHGMVSLWDRHIAHRPLARTRLGRISDDPAILVRFQDELVADGIKATIRHEILKFVRALLRWLRSRHPNVLRIDVSGIVKPPKLKRSRLAYAADAIGIERIIEAVLKRPARNDLLVLRDAALVAAMSYTIASRPSEWIKTARRENLYPQSVELQRAADFGADEDGAPGLKTGAHVALVQPNGYDRIKAYMDAVDEMYGPQPGNALIFQVIGPDGPEWIYPEDGGEPEPLAWSDNYYLRWTARVWRPARAVAAQAPDAPAGIDKMVFYDCRHTAISMAMHSTLVVGPHGMNLHPLAQWSGHDVSTLQRYYSHIIARYLGMPPIDLDQETATAKAYVEANPFTPPSRPAPQREQQRRRRRGRAKDASPARELIPA